MASQNPSRYELGHLVLEYLRTFTWPSVIIIFALLYWQDLLQVIEQREVNIFGVEIGPSVARLQETTEQELTDIELLVAELTASVRRDLETAVANDVATESPPDVSKQTEEAVEAVETKLAKLRDNLSEEAQVIAQQSMSAVPQESFNSRLQAPSAGRAKAEALEREGFEAILNRRLDLAASAFKDARSLWPDYHNVAEIAQYLSNLLAKPQQPSEAQWAAVERRILTEFSWGMPDDLRKAFRANVASSKQASG